MLLLWICSNTQAICLALRKWKGTLCLDNKPSYHCLGSFPNTPNKMLDWKSVKLSKSHLCSRPWKTLLYPEAYL